MRELKQSTAANVIIFMADSTDHITGKTGLTLTVTLSKDGGAFNSISPTVTERTSGWYNVAFTTSHADTVGDLVARATGTGADASERVFNVVANVEADTYARVGAPAGASVSADVAAVKTDTAATLVESQSHPTLAEIEATAVLAKEATLAHATYGLAALNTDLDALLTRLTATRAGYLDNLNTGVPLSAASVDAILDEVVEGTLTLRQIMRINLAALAGKSSGGGTATLIFKGADGTTTRITATVDADGNRTAVTVSGA